MENFKWWGPLDEGKKHVLIYLALAPHPLSLDTLIAVGRLTAVEILQFLGDLAGLGVLKSDTALKKGFYSLAGEGEFATFILKEISREDVKARAQDLISYYEATPEDDTKQCIMLAHLYRTAGFTPAKPDCYLSAAVHCGTLEMHDEAIAYYRMILDSPRLKIESLEEKENYVNAAIGITKAYGQMLSLPEQSAFLQQARHFADEINDRERLLILLLALGKTREVEGFYEKAAVHLDQAWQLAQE